MGITYWDEYPADKPPKWDYQAFLVEQGRRVIENQSSGVRFNTGTFEFEPLKKDDSTPHNPYRSNVAGQVE